MALLPVKGLKRAERSGTATQATKTIAIDTVPENSKLKIKGSKIE